MTFTASGIPGPGMGRRPRGHRDHGRDHRPGTRAGRTVLAVLTALTLVTLTACSTGPEEPSAAKTAEHFGYLVNAPLETTNAAGNLGVSTNAQLLSGRLYPAVFVPGPAGQMIPNTDLVQTQVLPGANRQVIYTLTEQARYSDGAPITCTDFLLHYKAGVMEDLFSSHLPLTRQIERMDCLPGDKRFTVVFEEGEGGRWRHLFGPGTVLPSHVIARQAGLSEEELVTALQNEDYATLQEVARIWRDGFSLREFDPELQVSSGPFSIEAVGEHGEVSLVRNEHYFGDQAHLRRLVVWPRGTDAAGLADEGALRVADVPDATPEWVNRDDPMNPYEIESGVGDLTDFLLLGDAGVFSYPGARQAFAACVDQHAVAAASSRVSGVDVPAVGVHSVAHDDPVRYQLADITEPHLGVDLERARGLAGTTVRIGYVGPNERKAAMVEAIRASCEPAGITVVDASTEGDALGDLTRVTVGQWGQQQVQQGPLDAVLMAVDPMAEADTASARATAVEELRATETELWERVPSIPLAAQPRTFVIDREVGNVVVYTGMAGIGWNMDRWQVSSEDNGAARDPEATE